MLNLKMWLVIAIIIAVLFIGYKLGMGYRKGNCVLCKSFSQSAGNIVDNAESTGKLDQSDANTLVTEIVKLGTVNDDGTFDISSGNEDKYKVMFESLAAHNYNINYASIIAEPASGTTQNPEAKLGNRDNT